MCFTGGIVKKQIPLVVVYSGIIYRFGVRTVICNGSVSCGHINIGNTQCHTTEGERLNNIVAAVNCLLWRYQRADTEFFQIIKADLRCD